MNTLILSFLSVILSNFYALSFQDINGATISMSTFQNKKILIVNITTDSVNVHQLVALEQLYQQYQDSLVVIAFPSNSFGNESKSDIQIKQFLQDSINYTFLVAAKGSVAGANCQLVFKWLCQKSENGDMNATVKGDFQKYLITRNGHIGAVLSPKVNPMSNEMIDAVTSTY